MIGEYNIPRHVILTFSLRADSNSLPLASHGGSEELGPSDNDSPVIGLGDLIKKQTQVNLFYSQLIEKKSLFVRPSPHCAGGI